MSFLRPVTSLRPGDHACLVYDDERRRNEMLLSFFEAGLVRDERVVYFATEVDEQVGAQLSGRGRPGQVAVLLADETYLAGGTFVPDRVLSMMRAAVDGALADGFGALRAGGGPPARVTHNGHSHLLLECERKANQLFERQEMLAICAYDTRTTRPESLLGIIDAHPLVFYAVQKDPRLRVSVAAPHRLVLRGWLDMTTLGGLVGPLADAVATGEDVELNLEELNFIDVSGLRLFVEAADMLHERERGLRLKHAPEWIPPILNILGYEHRKGLVVQ